MRATSYYYNYEPKNLDLVNVNIISGNFDISVLISACIILIVGIFIYYNIPKIAGFWILNGIEKQKDINKNKIKELILMKEIQSEIEKEIDEALLNIGLKSGS